MEGLAKFNLLIWRMYDPYHRPLLKLDEQLRFGPIWLKIRVIVLSPSEEKGIITSWNKKAEEARPGCGDTYSEATKSI